MKRISFVFLIKILVGIALIVYLIQGGFIDYKTLAQSIQSPSTLFLSFLCLFGMTVFSAKRLGTLLKIQNMKLPYQDLFHLTLTGQFCNIFMPGAVGGDLIKVFYLIKIYPQHKIRSTFFLILDRLIGLGTLLCFTILSSLFLLPQIWTTPELKAGYLFLLSGLSITVITLFLLLQKKILLSPGSLVAKRLPFFIPLNRVIDQARSKLRLIPQLAFYTLLPAFCIIGLWMTQLTSIDTGLSTAQILFLIPLGLLASAIPLFPGGIGVGQVAFYNLFQWMGSPHPQIGSTLCTTVQVLTLTFSLLGAYSYLRYRPENHETHLTKEELQT